MSRTSLERFRVPEMAAPFRKNKTISFRVTDDIYEVLEVTAEQNNMTFSTLLSFMINDYLEIQGMTHRKSQYFNSLSEERQSEILRQENEIPPEYRHFTLARKYYPNAREPDDSEASGGRTGANG